MVVSTVGSWVDGSADLYGDPRSGGFGTVGSAEGGVSGTVLSGGFYGANPEDVVVDDGVPGGLFDQVQAAIDAATEAVPPDLTDIELDPPDDGGGLLDDLPGVLGGVGGGLGSMLGEGGPDDLMSRPFGGLDDAFDPPMHEVTPNVIEDGWGGDELPVSAAPDVDDEVDLDLDLGSVLSPGIVSSPVGDGVGGILDDLDVDLGGVSGPADLGDDSPIIDDLGVDAVVRHDIDPIGGDVDYGGDDFSLTNGGDPGSDFGADDLDLDLGSGMELPDIEVPASTEFQQSIEAADNVESSLDDLFGDLA